MWDPSQCRCECRRGGGQLSGCAQPCVISVIMRHHDDLDGYTSYKRLKGRSHPVEKRISMLPHKPHATKCCQSASTHVFHRGKVEQSQHRPGILCTHEELTEVLAKHICKNQCSEGSTMASCQTSVNRSLTDTAIDLELSPCCTATEPAAALHMRVQLNQAQQSIDPVGQRGANHMHPSIKNPATRYLNPHMRCAGNGRH